MERDESYAAGAGAGTGAGTGAARDDRPGYMYELERQPITAWDMSIFGNHVGRRFEEIERRIERIERALPPRPGS
jgi:hypothetical protein